MLTQTADYALRALVYLAHDPEDGYHQTRDLATQLNIPGNYLGKILQLMAHHRIVESQRGMHGGFRLARLPEQVRLFDVLSALDAVPTDPECPLTTGGRQMELCGLHRRFAAMTRQYLDFLKATTLGELLVDHSMPASCLGPVAMNALIPNAPACTRAAGLSLAVVQ